MLEKPKLSFNIDLITIKVNRAFTKGNLEIPQKLFHNHYCLNGYLGINDRDFTLSERCETHKQLKERETFEQHRLYPLDLNEKEEYFY